MEIKEGNPITQQDFSSLFFGGAVFAVTLQKLDGGLGPQGAPKQHTSDLSTQLQLRPS